MTDVIDLIIALNTPTQEPDWPLPTKGAGYAKIYKVCNRLDG